MSKVKQMKINKKQKKQCCRNFNFSYNSEQSCSPKGIQLFSAIVLFIESEMYIEADLE